MATVPTPNPVPPHAVSPNAANAAGAASGAGRAASVAGQSQLSQFQGQQTQVVAKAAWWYRVSHYLMALILLGSAIWFIKDGFWTWPEQRLEFDRADRGEIKLSAEDMAKFHRSDFDIALQKGLGIGLIPLAALTLLWTLYNSRGVYRLSGHSLSVPGHPTISLDQITRIDRHKWDRKGVAYLSYDTTAGTTAASSKSGKTTGRLKLDDWVYEREPTDEIFKRVEDYAAGNGGEATA